MNIGMWGGAILSGLTVIAAAIILIANWNNSGDNAWAGVFYVAFCAVGFAAGVIIFLISLAVKFL